MQKLHGDWKTVQIKDIRLYGDRWRNGTKYRGFAVAYLIDGESIYLGDVKGFTGACDECDRLGYATSDLREALKEFNHAGTVKVDA